MKNEKAAVETREAELIELINQTRREMKEKGLHAELLRFYKDNAELGEQLKGAKEETNVEEKRKL